MNRTHKRHERSERSVMVESLENRALMSATTVGLCDGSVRPQLPAVQKMLLPAVQPATSPQTNSGIIAILIGL